MGNKATKLSDDQLYEPYKLAHYLNNNDICKAQTTHLYPQLGNNGKLRKKPGHRWKNNRPRILKYDEAIMIMTGDILVIDIDDKVDDINKYLQLPEKCWVDYTPSGGCHIYLKNDVRIQEYNTTVGLKLWGFKNVDILIKNGFAYAGGTSYYNPIHYGKMIYRWDVVKNPTTIERPGEIPTEWKKDILEKLEGKTTKYINNLKHWLLGCDGIDNVCHGCEGLVPNENYGYLLYLVSTCLNNKNGGPELIHQWMHKNCKCKIRYEISIKSDDNPYTNDSIHLEEIKKASSHGKVQERHRFLRNIIASLDIKQYYEEESYISMIEFIKREGGSRDIAEEFTRKINPDFNMSLLKW